MSAGLRLEDYLKQQLEGGRLHSSGQFTLDLAKARERLQCYRLPGPSFYLLKLVQAAVASDAPRVKIRLGTAETIVSFCAVPDAGLGDVKALLDGLAAPFELTDGPLRHLVIGLGAALATEPERMRWLVRQGRNGLSLNFTGQQLKSEQLHFDPSQDQQVRCTLYLRHRYRWWRFWEAARRRAEDYHLLADRCRHSPVPVGVNGREFEFRWNYQALHADREWYRGTSFCLGEHYYLEPGSGLRFSRPPLPGYQMHHGVNVWKDALWSKNMPAVNGSEPRCYFFQVFDAKGDVVPNRQMTSKLECRAALMLPISLVGPARIGFVKDGVLLDYTSLELGLPGLVAHYPAPRDLKLDLTEFKVVQDQALESAISCLPSQGQALFQMVSDNQELVKPESFVALPNLDFSNQLAWHLAQARVSGDARHGR